MKFQLLGLYFLSLGSLANTRSMSVDYVRGEGDVEGFKIAAQWHAHSFTSWSEQLSVYVETSVNFWEYGGDNSHDTNFVLAVSPVFQYPVFKFYGKPIYIEAGIGIAFLDDTVFAGKEVSTHYQFEDRVGFLYRFGHEEQNQLSVRYFHYSNGGLQRPNPGLDFISLSYMHKL